MSAIRDPVFGCLLVTSRLDRDGYAFHGKMRAHIVAWSSVNGPVPAEREVDHICRRRHCVEPTHLEAVTRDENERRKSWAWRKRRTTCPRGHSLSGAAITPEQGRLCRTCLGDVLRGAVHVSAPK
jgi:hypothetical protein